MENCNNIIVINLGGVEIYYECADMQNRQISQIVCADFADMPMPPIPQYRNTAIPQRQGMPCLYLQSYN
jgi:hypothetical protein